MIRGRFPAPIYDALEGRRVTPNGGSRFGTDGVPPKERGHAPRKLGQRSAARKSRKGLRLLKPAEERGFEMYGARVLSSPSPELAIPLLADLASGDESRVAIYAQQPAKGTGDQRQAPARRAGLFGAELCRST